MLCVWCTWSRVIFTVWIAVALAAGLADGDDESTPALWDLRLVGGNGSNSGELQAYMGSLGWFSFCSAGFAYLPAHVACTLLGYPFFLDTYEIEGSSNQSGAVTYINCDNNIPRGTEGTMSECRHDSAFVNGCGLDTHVGLICDDQHNTTEDMAVVAFYDDFQFLYIDPTNNYYFYNCDVPDFFCSGVHLVTISESAILQVIINAIWKQPPPGSQPGCGMNCASVFLVEHSCGNPESGDVFLGEWNPAWSTSCNSSTTFDGDGELTLYTSYGEWVGVCADQFGYLEAQVVCAEVSYPFVKNIYGIERSVDRQAIESIRCSGGEGSVHECNIQSNLINCTHTVGITCGDEWMITSEGYATVVLEGTQPLLLTLIVPDHDHYITNCTVSQSSICPGVYHLNSTSSGVQLLISQTQSSDKETCFIPELYYTDVPGTQNCGESQDSGSSSSSPVAAVAGGTVAGVVCLLAAIVLVVLALVIRRRRQKQLRRREWENMWPPTLLDATNCKRPSPRPPQYRALTFNHQPVRRKSSATGASIKDVHWEIPFGCITLEEEVGSGAYGSIHRGVIACEHQGNAMEVAVKLLKSGAIDSEHRALLLEIDMMKEIGYHRNVVSMLACCTKGERLALVMEYIPYGNLQSFLKKKRTDSGNEDPYAFPATTDQRYTPERNMGRRIGETNDSHIDDRQRGVSTMSGSLSTMELVQFARQITLGMEYLSSLKIVHRDLATRNILIDKDMIMKVSDFGLSRDIYSDQCYHMESIKDRLPVRWMAPESIIDRDFTIASDVWSFGITLWEILTYASFPYFNLSNTEVIENVQKGYRMPQPSECPDEVYEIMLSCWSSRPKDRPSFGQILKMLDSLLDNGEYTSLLSLSKPGAAGFGLDRTLETIPEGDGV